MLCEWMCGEEWEEADYKTGGPHGDDVDERYHGQKGHQREGQDEAGIW